MSHRTIDCHQSCKGICTSLEVASASEQKAIALYEELRDQCNYPDIRQMIESLIAKRQEMLRLIEETRTKVREQFDVLDQVQAGFEDL